jgi:hypothetical protein
MVAAGSYSTVVEREKSVIITAYDAKIAKMAHSRGTSVQILLKTLQRAYFEGWHENTRSMRGQYFTDVVQYGVEAAPQMAFLVEHSHDAVHSLSHRSVCESLN